MIQTLISETGPSVIYLGAENKLHTCKSVNVRKTSILGPNNNFDIISTPSHKSIKFNLIQEFEFLALGIFRNG